MHIFIENILRMNEYHGYKILVDVFPKHFLAHSSLSSVTAHMITHETKIAIYIALQIHAWYFASDEIHHNISPKSKGSNQCWVDIKIL